MFFTSGQLLTVEFAAAAYCRSKLYNQTFFRASIATYVRAKQYDTYCFNRAIQRASNGKSSLHASFVPQTLRYFSGIGSGNIAYIELFQRNSIIATSMHKASLNVS